MVTTQTVHRKAELWECLWTVHKDSKAAWILWMLRCWQCSFCLIRSSSTSSFLCFVVCELQCIYLETQHGDQTSYYSVTASVPDDQREPQFGALDMKVQAKTAPLQMALKHLLLCSKPQSWMKKLAVISISKSILVNSCHISTLNLIPLLPLSQNKLHFVTPAYGLSYGLSYSGSSFTWYIWNFTPYRTYTAFLNLT